MAFYEEDLKVVLTDDAPEAIGPYSQAIECGGIVFSSGQLPIDPATGKIESADIAGQAAQAIKNLAAVLLAAGSNINRVVKTTCYLKDIKDFAVFNEVYARFFANCPARSCVEVSALPKGALVEIEAIAVKN